MNGEPYTKDMLRGEAASLIITGSETTSSIFATFYFYLTRGLSAFSYLAFEICETFTSPDEIVSGPKPASCIQFHACIDEMFFIAADLVSESPVSFSFVE